LVEGVDVRVHVVGAAVFATEIISEDVDYRYPRSSQPEMRPSILPEPILARCLELSASMDLSLAGIDFKRTPEGRYVCLEVNPAPAFTCFEERTGQKIASAVARYLASSQGSISR